MSSFRKRPHRLLKYVWIALVGVVLSGCAMSTAPQTMFVPQGNGSAEILSLFRPVFWVAVAVFVVVEGLLLYSIIRYRRKPQDGIPLQIHGNTPIEIMWTIIPAIIVVGIATLTFRTQSILVQDEQQSTLNVTVVGHQWWWEFQYPDYGFVTANELRIPAGTQVRFTLKSADVIHSFWLPRLSGKTDVVPGETNILSFKALEPSKIPIRGQCAEFCGATHAMMGMWAIVETPTDFNAWVKRQQAQAVTPAGINQAAQPAGTAVGATALAQAQASSEAQAPGATSTNNQAEANTVATVGPTANASTNPNAQATSLEAKGYQLFQAKGCVACHAISGYPGAVSQIGPNLTHVASRGTIVAGWLQNTPENLRRWLRNPNDVKPGNVMASVIKLGTLKPDEIDALTAYLQSLK